MRSSIRFLAGALCAGVLVSLAGATVTPDSGTIGTQFTAVFDADVGSKPKLTLSYREPMKKAKSPKAKAKLVSSDGTNVTFVIQAVKGAGTFDVGVAKSDAQAGTVTMSPPRVDSTSASSVAAGGDLTVNGLYFGEFEKKKLAPKVFVNGKKAKVTGFTNTSVSIRLHKSTPEGLATIAVQSNVGEGSLMSGTTVTAPPVPIKGADTLSAVAGRNKLVVKFTKKTPEAVVTIFGGVLQTLQLSAVKTSGSTKNKTIQTLNFIVDVDVDDLANLELPATFTSVGLVTYQLSTIKISGGIPPSVTSTSTLWDNDRGTTPFTVTISNVSGGRIAGTFSGSLNLSAGNGTSTLQISGGKFVTTVN